MTTQNKILRTIAILAFSFIYSYSYSQVDTLRVMSYNVLNYGGFPLCQGPNGTYHSYLKKIVTFANPDIVGLVKMGAIRLNTSDFHSTAPLGFADSVLQNALNAAYPDRFDYCTFTNNSQADNMSVLFYNKHKLGFLNITFTYANITDFNTYKLYYKDSALAQTHDTTFLYIVLNHTKSGSSNEQVRGSQINGEMQLIEQHFHSLPNMINMGDFNTRKTGEACYQAVVNPANNIYGFYDPPFSLDNKYTYPANWDNNTALYTSNLTTSTRQNPAIPNSCGTGGGAKSWYDHIFLSPWIANNKNYVSYIPGSYRTIGNDGHRMSISINDSSQYVNNSAPADVIEALFQMSNKYPVMIDLAVTSNTSGVSPTDTEIPASVKTIAQKSDLYVVNPIKDALIISSVSRFKGQKITFKIIDLSGRVLVKSQLQLNEDRIQVPIQLQQGIYLLRITDHEQRVIYNNKIIKI